MQIRHLRQQISDFHVVSCFHWHRVQRPISRCCDPAVPDFAFESGYFVLQLLYAQRHSVCVQPYAMFKFLLDRREPRHFSLRLHQCQVVRGKLFFRRRLLRHQALQCIVGALQTIAISLSLRQIACSTRRRVASSSSFRRAQIILRVQELFPRIRQLSSGVLYVQIQQRLPSFHCLSFEHVDLFNKRVQLRPHHVRRNGLHFSVAGDGRNQIPPPGHHRRNFGCRLPSAQPHQAVGQRPCQQEENHYAIAQSAIHFPLFFANLLRQAQPRVQTLARLAPLLLLFQGLLAVRREPMKHFILTRALRLSLLRSPPVVRNGRRALF